MVTLHFTLKCMYGTILAAKLDLIFTLSQVDGAMTLSLTTLDITIKMHHSANIMLSHAVLAIMMRTLLLIHILADCRNLAQCAECR
jgi:hypothetical protein